MKVVVDPTLPRNMREIVVRGEFGELRTVVENVPSTTNPKTASWPRCLHSDTKQVCEPLKVAPDR